MRRPALVMTIALAAWLGIFGARAASAKIAISPAYVETQLDKGRATGEFTITNDGDDEERLRINTHHFIFTRDGGIAIVPADEHSMAPWIVFNPKEFNVPPKSRRSIRWVVVPRGEVRPGHEYWCLMDLESLNTTVATSTDAEGRQMKIEIVQKVYIPMFGMVGKINYKGSFNEARVAATKEGTSVVEALIVNEGDGPLLPHGKYEISDASGAVVAKGEGGLYGWLMPGNDRLFTSIPTDPLPAGKYTLRVAFTSMNLPEPLTKEVTFDWVPPPPPPPKTSKTPKKSEASGAKTPAAPAASSAAPPASAPASPAPATPPSAPAAGQ